MTSQRRIGGWLLVLSRLLILWQPIIIGLTTAQTLNGLFIRSKTVLLLVLLRALAAAAGVAAGLALSRGHAGAVRLTKWSLPFSAAVEMLVYLSPAFPSNRAPGETPAYVLATLLFYGGWFAYLVRSKRVRATFENTESA